MMRDSYQGGESHGMFAGLVQLAVIAILLALVITLVTSYLLTRYGRNQNRKHREPARHHSEGEPANRWLARERAPRGTWAPVFGLPVAVLFFRNAYELSGNGSVSFAAGGIGWVLTILVIVLLFDTYRLSAFKRWSILWHIGSVVAFWSVLV
jgi:hypothetical protein